MIRRQHRLLYIGSVVLLALFALIHGTEASASSLWAHALYPNVSLKGSSSADTTTSDIAPKIAGTTADSVEIMPGTRFFLEPNAPNPFIGTTTIGYSLDAETTVVLKVYDFFYKEVATLVDQVQPEGRYEVVFNPNGKIASGMYFYELSTTRGTEIRRMMFIR